jgi:hypothetical protein
MTNQFEALAETVTVTDALAEQEGKVEALAESVTVTDVLTGRADSPATEDFHVPSLRTRRKTVIEGESPELKDRIWDRYSSDYLARDNVVDIRVRVFDLQGDPVTHTHEWAHEWDEVMYATLQADASGEPDATGYNWLSVVPREWIPQGGHTYKVEYDITVLSTADGEDYRIIPVTWEIKVKSRRGR